MKQDIKAGNLSRIKNELERRLVVMRYSKVATSAYMRIFGWIEDFLKGYGETSYSKEAGERFLVEYLLQANHAPTQFKNARIVVRRIEEIIENKRFSPCFRKPKSEIPPRFEDCCDKYFEHLAERGLKEATIDNHKRYVKPFLGRLAERGVALEELTAADLYNVFTQYELPFGVFVVAKRLLVYLFEKGVISVNLSVCVPRPIRRRALPSVYSGAEVARLLSSVDRTTCKGKRDYAILTLAAKLGLRSSDIVNLSFKDIDHLAKKIVIVQLKTSRPLTLVMNSDVEEAVFDYIKNGRPLSSSDKIFLGSQAPFAPLTARAGHTIAHRHFSRAGIAPQGRQQGTQALRSSYATALVAKGIPYAMVQEALGHDDPESAKYYVRVDIRRLRTCALDVPKPTGAFAVLLGDLEGVL